MDGEERSNCWKARDLYLACLASSCSAEDLYTELRSSSPRSQDSEIIPQKFTASCEQLQKAMYSTCPLSWAEHFEKKFRGDKLKEIQMKRLKDLGAQPL